MTTQSRYALALMVFLLAADQVVKIWVRNTIPMFQSTELIPYFIDLTHVENKGVSFSFLGNLGENIRVPMLVTISVLAIGLIGYFWWDNRNRFNTFAHLAFVLILPGAFGNLIDRAIYGTVTDYFHFRFFSTSFFVNNLADIYISMGVVAYAVAMFKPSPEDSSTT